MRNRTYFVKKTTLQNGQVQFSVVKKVLDFSVSRNIGYIKVEGYNVSNESACRKLADRLEGEIVVSTEYL